MAPGMVAYHVPLLIFLLHQTGIVLCILTHAKKRGLDMISSQDGQHLTGVGRVWPIIKSEGDFGQGRVAMIEIATTVLQRYYLCAEGRWEWTNRCNSWYWSGRGC